MLETLPSKGQLAILSESPHSGFHALIVEEILREVRLGNQFVPLEDARDALTSQDHQQIMYIIIIIIYTYIINVVYAYIYILMYIYIYIKLGLYEYQSLLKIQGITKRLDVVHLFKKISFWGGTILPYTYGFKET